MLLWQNEGYNSPEDLKTLHGSQCHYYILAIKIIKFEQICSQVKSQIKHKVTYERDETNLSQYIFWISAEYPFA